MCGPTYSGKGTVSAIAGRSRDLYTVVSSTGSTDRSLQGPAAAADVTDEGAGVVIDSFQGARPSRWVGFGFGFGFGLGLGLRLGSGFWLA